MRQRIAGKRAETLAANGLTRTAVPVIDTMAKTNPGLEPSQGPVVPQDAADMMSETGHLCCLIQPARFPSGLLHGARISRVDSRTIREPDSDFLEMT